MGHKMSYHALFKYGAAGSTASTVITNIRDKKIDLEPQVASTTEAGDGTEVPIDTEEVTSLKVSFEWTMLEKDNDATLAALKSAAMSGTPVALRTQDYESGLGYDGDVILKMSANKPLNGEASITFTATPNRSERDPQLFV